VGVTGFAGADEKLFEVVDIFVDPKILRAVEPEFAGAGVNGEERKDREEN